jgi:signal peptidase II
LILDQATKAAIQELMALHESVEVIPGLFHLTYIQNTGAAFGILSDAPATFRVAFLIGVSLAALGVLSVIFARVPVSRWEVLVPLALIMGGAAGNLIDRMYLQKVVDFLDFFYKEHHWPSFNVADSAITIGTVTLMAVSFFSRGGDLFSKGA